MSKYLVTGGAGFIGSNLVERLLQDGQEVAVIDDLSTGSRGNVPPKVPIFTSSYKVSLRAFEKGELCGVFHLGAPSNSLLYRENRNFVASAINDFIDVLEFVRDMKLRLVYVSSSSLYNGNPTPWKEDMLIIPKDFYTETRYSWERLAKVYRDFYGVESVGLRLFSVYGPKEESKGIYANLFTQLLWAKERGEVFDVYGDGCQERDTVYVADVVEAFILAMNSNIRYDIFNIGTGKNYTINQMASMLRAKIRYIVCPLPNYVQATLADTTKAEKMLRFTAKVSLDEGLSLLLKRKTSEPCRTK
jgi:UDP-glucose 4-epimerase